eukprot:NODE_3890_length_867_cov_4.019560_g3228_i0.p7 GENE.NODE_3890_length_867_cov_4.019560_g3228_i0~~NODE_3890_length_867_cov_4.019560_g3228_i0.p7  ORF type:complete len:53 (+),score=1.97 NODE_3890_length_867_cov_4.019560_g3228_i0:558-716(+)
MLEITPDPSAFSGFLQKSRWGSAAYGRLRQGTTALAPSLASPARLPTGWYAS